MEERFPGNRYKVTLSSVLQLQRQSEKAAHESNVYLLPYYCD